MSPIFSFFGRKGEGYFQNFRSQVLRLLEQQDIKQYDAAMAGYTVLLNQTQDKPELNIFLQRMVNSLNVKKGEPLAFPQSVSSQDQDLKDKKHDLGLNARKSVRIRVNIPIPSIYSLQETSKIASGFILNISCGGLYFQTPVNFSEGELICFEEIVLADLGSLRKVFGQVAHSQPGPMPGFGVEFVALDPEETKQVESFCALSSIDKSLS